MDAKHSCDVKGWGPRTPKRSKASFRSVILIFLWSTDSKTLGLPKVFFILVYLRSCQQPPPRGTITRGASARSRASATTIPQSSTGTAQPISTTPLSPAVAAADTASASRHTSQPSLAPAPFSATRNARGVNGASSGTTATPRTVRRAMTAGDWSSSRQRSTRRAELMLLVCRP